MLIEHKFSIDLHDPDVPARIRVKQGDAMTHALMIGLFEDGQPWMIPGDAKPVIRWFACNPTSGETARGIYDTLPNGDSAWNGTQNQLEVLTVPHMFAMPGVVQADVAFVKGDKILATCNFEFCVHHAPADGTEPEAQNFYKVATLEQINQAISDLEQEVSELKQMVTQR